MKYEFNFQVQTETRTICVYAKNKKAAKELALKALEKVYIPIQKGARK